MSEKETIVTPQREIAGAIYHDQDCVGLTMREAGADVAEIWISAASIDDLMGWLEHAKAALGMGRAE